MGEFRRRLISNNINPRDYDLLIKDVVLGHVYSTWFESTYILPESSYIKLKDYRHVYLYLNITLCKHPINRERLQLNLINSNDIHRPLFRTEYINDWPGLHFYIKNVENNQSSGSVSTSNEFRNLEIFLHLYNGSGMYNLDEGTIIDLEHQERFKIEPIVFYFDLDYNELIKGFYNQSSTSANFEEDENKINNIIMIGKKTYDSLTDWEDILRSEI